MILLRRWIARCVCWTYILSRSSRHDQPFGLFSWAFCHIRKLSMSNDMPLFFLLNVIIILHLAKLMSSLFTSTVCCSPTAIHPHRWPQRSISLTPSIRWYRCQSGYKYCSWVSSITESVRKRRQCGVAHMLQNVVLCTTWILSMWGGILSICGLFALYWTHKLIQYFFVSNIFAIFWSTASHSLIRNF